MDKIEKVCRICGLPKDIKEFCKRSETRDGRSNECRRCWSNLNKKAASTKQKEKDFWSQFSPI